MSYIVTRTLLLSRKKSDGFSKHIVFSLAVFCVPCIMIFLILKNPRPAFFSWTHSVVGNKNGRGERTISLFFQVPLYQSKTSLPFHILKFSPSCEACLQGLVFLGLF